jgi:hypothetical protein
MLGAVVVVVAMALLGVNATPASADACSALGVNLTFTVSEAECYNNSAYHVRTSQVAVGSDNITVSWDYINLADLFFIVDHFRVEKRERVAGTTTWGQWVELIRRDTTVRQATFTQEVGYEAEYRVLTCTATDACRQGMNSSSVVARGIRAVENLSGTVVSPTVADITWSHTGTEQNDGSGTRRNYRLALRDGNVATPSQGTGPDISLSPGQVLQGTGNTALWRLNVSPQKTYTVFVTACVAVKNETTGQDGEIRLKDAWACRPPARTTFTTPPGPPSARLGIGRVVVGRGGRNWPAELAAGLGRLVPDRQGHRQDGP